jgi:hypothetical protein
MVYVRSSIFNSRRASCESQSQQKLTNTTKRRLCLVAMKTGGSIHSFFITKAVNVKHEISLNYLSLTLVSCLRRQARMRRRTSTPFFCDRCELPSSFESSRWTWYTQGIIIKLNYNNSMGIPQRLTLHGEIRFQRFLSLATSKFSSLYRLVSTNMH